MTILSHAIWLRVELPISQRIGSVLPGAYAAMPLWYAAGMAFASRPTRLAIVCIIAMGGTFTLPAHSNQGALLLTLQGRGVQVYRCDAGEPSPSWALDHPEAELLNAHQKVVGHHDAGPSWRLDDGSTVKGEPVEKTPSPVPGAIPWLLIRATSHDGTGALANVYTIRRTQTRGGVAPGEGCDRSMVGATVRIPYTATYTFYGKP